MNVRNLAETPERVPWARVVKAAVVISCVVITAIAFGREGVYWLTRGSVGDVSRTVLVLALVLFSPAGLYAALIRTKVPVLCCGVGLVGLQAWGIWNAHQAGSSGLELFAIPLFGVPFVALCWAADIWIRAMRPLSPPS